MFKKLVMFSMISVSCSSLATDFEYGLGLGTQYGIVGGQVALKNDDQKYHLALGFGSASVGFQSAFGENKQYSWGLDVGKSQDLFGDDDQQFAAVTFNYHFDGFHRGGWEIGPSIIYREETYTSHTDGNKSKNDGGLALFFNLGYKF